MICKAVIFLGLTAFVVGDGHAISEQKVIMRSKPQYEHHGNLKHYGSHKPEHHEEYAWSYPSYEFYYKVDDPYTKDKKGHQESRDGDEVKGEYWLYEPDGRKRTVEYYSDKKSGFKATVKYSAPHKHEQYKSKEQKHDVFVEHSYKKDNDQKEDHHDDLNKKDQHDDYHKTDNHDDQHDEHHDNLHYDILKIGHKDVKKDDHYDEKDLKHDHKDDHDDHDDKYMDSDNKDHKNDHDVKGKDEYDDKRGHSSQVKPYLEQYRPFSYRQAPIQYDLPYPKQRYYRRSKNQY